MEEFQNTRTVSALKSLQRFSLCKALVISEKLLVQRKIHKSINSQGIYLKFFVEFRKCIIKFLVTSMSHEIAYITNKNANVKFCLHLQIKIQLQNNGGP
jgi:hypothetical protein